MFNSIHGRKPLSLFVLSLQIVLDQVAVYVAPKYDETGSRRARWLLDFDPSAARRIGKGIGQQETSDGKQRTSIVQENEATRVRRFTLGVREGPLQLSQARPPSDGGNLRRYDPGRCLQGRPA